MMSSAYVIYNSHHTKFDFQNFIIMQNRSQARKRKSWLVCGKNFAIRISYWLQGKVLGKRSQVEGRYLKKLPTRFVTIYSELR